MTVIYGFHGRFGAGPVINPVPVSARRRQVLAHRSPLDPVPAFRRARLRQRVPKQAPEAIPDVLWDKLFAVMGCDRDRAVLESYVSSGARASELLGVTLEDVDWAGQLFYVVSKGSRLRQPVPASPDAFRYLGRYLATDGLAGPGATGVADAARGSSAADVLGPCGGCCNAPTRSWAPITRCTTLGTLPRPRMAGDERLTLAEVQTILRHAHLDTTGHYLTVRIEDMHDKLLEHYTKPRQRRPS